MQESPGQDIVIDWLGGNCPVQAEGTICGESFYFRARGDRISIGIGGDPVAAPEFSLEEHFGAWPDAGWIDEVQAREFIEKAALAYRERKAGAPRA